ncbi:MAG TPA: Fur family transcriptional regulator [Alphaproteobacteria bacterium]|nr:Fur family transcriptional regulator [Alphaproteobacteria bacterium]
MKTKPQHDHSAKLLQVTELLQRSGIRPTRQRTALARYLFDGCDKHMTAEQVHAAMRKAKTGVSLATVYNTLHQFTEAGLMHQVVIDSNRVYFDTNIHDHHHFFDETTGMLHDVPAKHVHISRLPKLPAGRELDRVDVVIRLRAGK